MQKIEDIQSWWEVPSIAYFCSLFRSAFNLLDFDIEELEEALLTDGTEESASSLLTELIVRLLNGCLGNNDISAFNYQMYLRRLFRRKCQETGRYNPFNTDIDFQFLPLRTKVEILYALCDFRMDAEDVFDLFKNLEAESLRVEPLGWDDNDSAYWYFYGTRLYREDIIKKSKSKSKKKKSKESKKRGWFYGDDWLDDEETERVWQVVCFTEADWSHLTEKFSKATSKVEKELYRSLSQNFLPEIPRLFQEKERLQRKRLLELAPRRTSSRVLQKIKQKEEDTKPNTVDSKDKERKRRPNQARENRAKRRDQLRTRSTSNSSEDTLSEKDMPQKVSKRKKSQEKRSKNSSSTHKGEPPPDPPAKPGRKTNNSLASATGQILIDDNEVPVNSTRKKLKTSQIFSQTEEDIQTDMYKVLEQLTAHEDAWPFLDPVEEEYAPNYYAVIRRPMDLHKMEERLDSGHYRDFSMFKADFKLIVNNCRLYNGQDNEYTVMVDNLQAAFDRLTEKYIHRISSSDEEIAVEYQLPTPTRKHKLKLSESSSNHKRKKRKSHSDTGDFKLSTSSDHAQETTQSRDEEDKKETKESHKNKDGKVKKKRKSHRHHSKHSKDHKNHKSDSVKSSKHSKREKGKKSKQKKKKSKHSHDSDKHNLNRSFSQESLESSNRSRSASPLPSIHTPTPSPSPEPEKLDPDFYKDKFDKIKERRRNAAKDAWESLFEYKQNQKTTDKQKHNATGPGREKNQKLRETIEKLKAKNEKYKDSSLFNSLFPSTSHTNIDKSNSDSNLTKDSISKDDNEDFSDDDFDIDNQRDKHGKGIGKKTQKKICTAKNESASEALEQAVKDISKLLDDAPKGSTQSSPCDSPAQTVSTEDQENSRQDDESSQSEKGLLGKKDISRKRPSSREPKIVKRREIQRTIDRLQPGKSKGNLLTNIPTTQKTEEITSNALNKVRDTNKSEESSPKLSLGSVLPTVEFTLGNDHNFEKNEEVDTKEQINCVKETDVKPDNEDSKIPEKKVDEIVQEKDVETKVEPEKLSPKLCQEKATPNLSAWFKAFGAPKSTTSTATVKKKIEENEQDEKLSECIPAETKPCSPKNTTKFDSITEEISPNPEGGDSPLPNVMTTPRQRRTSTGSSVSERSSFSQDLDSPRHQIAHTSPLLRSPASPRTDDFQKISYPIINGTVRAGFYQDTTSIKSSPEKSCSPREGPQSPYSPYSQHVYASNNAMGATTPNYFSDHNKSPLPTYGQNQPPPYYDSSKAPLVSKPVRSHDDYIALGPDTFQPTQYNSTTFSPAPSPYAQDQPFISSPNSPHTNIKANTSTVAPAAQVLPDPKNSLFPVKKRVYNETEITPATINKISEVKENILNPSNKDDFPKVVQSSIHSIASLPMNSVDEIAAALSEKSELAKLNAMREQSAIDYTDRQRHNVETRENVIYENNDNVIDKKKEIVVNATKSSNIMTKQDNIDMINMGYSNAEIERRELQLNAGELDFIAPREMSKPNVPEQKVYEAETATINLGVNNQQNLQKKPLNKTIVNINAQEKAMAGIGSSQTLPEYEMSMGSQNFSNFSLNDIENANKKLYSCNPVPSNTGIDYGNWKISNQIRKPDMLPSDYSVYSSNNSDKLKGDTTTAASNTNVTNYSKTIQHQQAQYHNYNSSRSNIQRSQDLQQNLPSELRIPNPRGLLKNDSPAAAISNSDIIPKNMESSLKGKSSEKLIQSHPLVSSLQYKPTYGSHSSLQLESLRNLPQMLERYSNDERYLSSFPPGTSSLYHDKSFQMAQMSQMFTKSLGTDVHPPNSTVIYSQASMPIDKSNRYNKGPINLQTNQTDTKTKSKRKKTSDSKQSTIMSTQSYHTPTSNTDVLSSVKTSMVPGSAFNFGTTTNMALGGGLYGDNTGFSIEDFRNSTANHIMAANYMAAAVAHQRNNTETNTEKLVKPAHQNSSHTPPTSFPFINHSQVRAGYQFVGTDPSSPLYQQYLQRHQEELLRQTGAQIMGLYPPGYPGSLGVRQPYDSINRPSWI